MTITYKASRLYDSKRKARKVILGRNEKELAIHECLPGEVIWPVQVDADSNRISYMCPGWAIGK